MNNYLYIHFLLTLLISFYLLLMTNGMPRGNKSSRKKGQLSSSNSEIYAGSSSSNMSEAGSAPDFELENFKKLTGRHETKDFTSVINEAKQKIVMNEHSTLYTIISGIIKALNDRKLSVIRLIGLGSMFPFPPGSNKHITEDVKKKMQRSVYQMAFSLLIIEHFQNQNNIKIKVTAEDKHLFTKKEIQFLKSVGIKGILVHDTNEENLEKIEKDLLITSSDQVTLIIMFSCSPKMTSVLLETYKEQIGNLILLESAIGSAKLRAKMLEEMGMPVEKDINEEEIFRSGLHEIVQLPATDMVKEYFDTYGVTFLRSL